ncbi:ABC transporter substrate-binding protein [Paenibacillus humicola]|uniref:ABC transporter substrate-binding protein n=1 Tax=Paenibacillus humicola TaxID=3110540 RepID=UPI00237B9194|nr:ABC transporter substrate-binding protein [Paenibacillus humicola]
MRKGFISVIILIFVAVLSGCGSKKEAGTSAGSDVKNTDAKTESASKAPSVIKFGVQPSTQPPFIAEELGLFDEIEKKYNTSIEFVKFASGGPENNALAAGEISWAEYGMAPAIVGMDKADGLLTSVDVLNETALIAAPDIASAADLKGKTVGFPGKGSQQYPLMLLALEQAGMKEADINLISMDAGNMTEALKNGQLSAFIAWDPFITTAVKNGTGKTLLSSDQIMPLKDGHYLGEGTVVKRGFAEDYPELTQDMVDALAKANAYIVDHPDEVPAMWNKAVGLDPAVIEYSLQNKMAVYVKNIQPDPASLKAYIDMLNKYEITQISDVDLFLKDHLWSGEYR